MPLTKQQIEDLEAELESNGGKITKAAGRLRLELPEVISYVRQRGLGNIKLPRPELEKYIVATRVGVGAWIVTEALSKARKEYDAGLVELCTYRFEDNFYLLKIPRKHPVGRRTYFGREFTRV